jgi:hypothetical protein
MHNKCPRKRPLPGTLSSITPKTTLDAHHRREEENQKKTSLTRPPQPRTFAPRNGTTIRNLARRPEATTPKPCLIRSVHIAGVVPFAFFLASQPLTTIVVSEENDKRVPSERRVGRLRCAWRGVYATHVFLGCGADDLPRPSCRRERLGSWVRDVRDGLCG